RRVVTPDLANICLPSRKTTTVGKDCTPIIAASCWCLSVLTVPKITSSKCAATSLNTGANRAHVVHQGAQKSTTTTGLFSTVGPSEPRLSSWIAYSTRLVNG